MITNRKKLISKVAKTKKYFSSKGRFFLIKNKVEEITLNGNVKGNEYR